MKKWIIGIVLTIVIIGSIVGFWQVNEQKEKLTLQLEGAYLRNFFALVDEVDAIEEVLATTLVTSDREQMLLALSNLYRSVYVSINNIGSVMPAISQLENTVGYLNDLAEFSYYLLKERVLKDVALSEDDWSRLESFYNRAQVVKKELSQVEAKIVNNSIKLSEIEIDEDNVLSEAFLNIENNIKGFKLIQLEEGVRKIEPKVREISGSKVSEDMAISIAEDFYKKIYNKEGKAKVEFDSSNVPIEVYGINVADEVYIEVSKVGGFIMQMYGNRNINEVNYSLEDANEYALEFMQTLGLKNMQIVESDDLTNSADITLVPKEDGVYIYADMVKVLVARDNLQILSFDQSSYISYHYERSLPEAKLSATDIVKKMNPHFVVESINLALLVDDYAPKEYLAYELRGKMNDESFAIFVNAVTGSEEKIVRLTKKKEYEFKLDNE